MEKVIMKRLVEKMSEATVLLFREQSKLATAVTFMEVKKCFD